MDLRGLVVIQRGTHISFIASMMKKRAHDNGKVKQDQVKRSRLCLNKKRLDNPEMVKADQNEQQQRHREVKNTSD